MSPRCLRSVNRPATGWSTFAQSFSWLSLSFWCESHALRPLGPRSQEEAVTGIRRTTLAARLKAIYGSVNRIDAFVGLLSERHVAGTEFGPLQLAMWKQQFEALRDGDRFFYRNDPELAGIGEDFGITYRHTLAELISLNSGAHVPADVFEVAPSDD